MLSQGILINLHLIIRSFYHNIDLTPSKLLLALTTLNLSGRKLLSRVFTTALISDWPPVILNTQESEICQILLYEYWLGSIKA